MFFHKRETLSQKQIEKEERKWANEKPLLERQRKIQEEKREYYKPKFLKPSTSKMLIGFLFINCTVIEIFTGWATIQMLSVAMATGLSIDFSPLVALVGAVVSEVFGYAIYSLKATKENSIGGITYDLAMKEAETIAPPDEENSVG